MGGHIGSCPRPTFRPTLLVNVCETDGRGRGSAGAQGETEAPGPRGRSGTPFLTWVKLSRNAWRDVRVKDLLDEDEELCQHTLFWILP